MATLPAGLQVRGHHQVKPFSSSSSSSPPQSRGRGLFASKAFAPGAALAVFDQPLVVLPASPTATLVCNACLDVRRQPVKACTGCRAVAYCGARCQKADWGRVHKGECKALRAAVASSGGSAASLPTPVRALLQILLQWPTVRACVDQLEGHVDAFRRLASASSSPSSPLASLWNDFAVQALAACTFAQWRTSEENLQIAVAILCKIHTNAFDRADPDLGYTGTFLDAGLAMLNHSCVPNAVVAFVGRKAYLRAELPISAGDEITISYIDYTKPKSARQRGLDLYHFVCDCPRCAADLDVYQVCAASPVLSLNAFSFVPDLPAQASRASVPPPAVLERIYAECLPEMAVAPAAAVAAAARLARLRRMWAICRPLVDAGLWALEPLAHVLQQAIIHYLEQHQYAQALAVECFVALRSDPYKHAAPFAAWRLKGLLMVAKTLTNTGAADQEANAALAPLLLRLADGALYEAILLMVLRYGPMAHSDEWELLATAREMLQDVQSVGGRELLSAALRHWIEDPTEAQAAAFFREQVLAPVEGLALLAVDLLEADLGHGR